MSASDNYLDFIPMPSDTITYDVSDGKVTIYKENKGFFNLIAQKLFKRPRITQIHLDDMGNFIWPLMDGKRSIYDIAGEVKNKYGEEAEPLYDRLVRYFKTLHDCSFVKYTNK